MDDLFEELDQVLIESVIDRRVDVEHPVDLIVDDDGHHDFRIGGAVTGNMTFEDMDIRDV